MSHVSMKTVRVADFSFIRHQTWYNTYGSWVHFFTLFFILLCSTNYYCHFFIVTENITCGKYEKEGGKKKELSCVCVECRQTDKFWCSMQINKHWSLWNHIPSYTKQQNTINHQSPAPKTEEKSPTFLAFFLSSTKLLFYNMSYISISVCVFVYVWIQIRSKYIKNICNFCLEVTKTEFMSRSQSNAFDVRWIMCADPTQPNFQQRIYAYYMTHKHVNVGNAKQNDSIKVLP